MESESPADRPVRLITWNVNHRSRAKAIPLQMADAIKSLKPDVVVLTEYFPGKSHDQFIDDLGSTGLVNMIMSPLTPKENHVLIASHHSLTKGDITAPPIAPSVPSNVQHVILTDLNLDVIGIRVPDYSNQLAIKRQCWDWILEATEAVKDRPSIFLGDFNTDPKYPRSRCGDCINELIDRGWQHAVPLFGRSYWTLKGSGVQIDHAFVSSSCTVQNAEFVSANNEYVFVGRGKKEAMSDHAVLVVDLAL